MNNFRKIILLLTASLFISKTAYQQDGDNVKSMKVGLNLGVYLSSKSYAQFYDGSPNFAVYQILTNPQIRQSLENTFGYPIKNWTYPINVKYNLGYCIGGHFGVHLDDAASIVLDMNITNLTTNSILAIELDDPSATGVQQNIENAKLIGKEQRFDINLGFENEFYQGEIIRAYGTLGLSGNYIQQMNNELIIRDRMRYSIKRPINFYLPNDKKIDGFGYGAYGSLGIRYPLNEKFTLDLGVNVFFMKNKRFVEEITYKTNYTAEQIAQASKFKFNESVFFRLIWN